MATGLIYNWGRYFGNKISLPRCQSYTLRLTLQTTNTARHFLFFRQQRQARKSTEHQVDVGKTALPLKTHLLECQSRDRGKKQTSTARSVQDKSAMVDNPS